MECGSRAAALQGATMACALQKAMERPGVCEVNPFEYRSSRPEEGIA
jgi:hypothetical protein